MYRLLLTSLFVFFLYGVALAQPYNPSLPGGSDQQIQYNNSGTFGGISGNTYDGTNVENTLADNYYTSTDTTNGAMHFASNARLQFSDLASAARPYIWYDSATLKWKFQPPTGDPLIYVVSGGLDLNNGSTTLGTTSSFGGQTTVNGDLRLFNPVTVYDGEAINFLDSGGIERGEIKATTTTTTVTPGAGIPLEILNTVATGVAAVNLQLYNNSLSPAIGDIMQQIDFYGKDSLTNKTNYAQISQIPTAVGNGSEKGVLIFALQNAGSLTTMLNMTGGDTITATAGTSVALNTPLVNFQHQVHFLDNEEILMGTGSDAATYYNGTDLIIDPDLVGTGIVRIGATSDNDLVADQIGIGGIIPSALGYIDGAGLTSSTRRAIIVADLEYTGSANSMGSFQVQAIENGSAANPTTYGGKFDAYTKRTAPTNANVIAGNFISGFSSSSIVQTAGVNTFSSADINTLNSSALIGGSHSGGTIIGNGIWCREQSAVAGSATVVQRCMFAENDIIMETGDGVVFEGSATTNGDSKIIYSGGIQTTVDGVVVGLMDNALPLKLTQPTNDVIVQQLVTTATNDDPTQSAVQGRIATTDATVTTIDTIATTSDTGIMVECMVAARRTGGVAGSAGDAAGYIHRCAYKNIAATLTELTDATDFAGESQAGWAVTCAPSSANILVQVTGAASNNVTWHSSCKWMQVGS